MHLMIGGAYQGKLTLAKKMYQLSDEQICDCRENTIDLSYPCVAHIEEFTYKCVLENVDPIAYFAERKECWKDSVLICRDISCGVVPIDATERKWREVNGKLCQYLSKEAEKVSRVFCGLEQRLK